MTGVKTITKKALHHLAGHPLVSIQEAVHMVDDQPLVICSDRMTYVTINQGQVLRDDLETDKRKAFRKQYTWLMINHLSYAPTE